MRVREIEPEDAEFVLDLAARFAECDLPAWRTEDEVRAGTERWLRKALDEPSERACVLVAEAEDGRRLGFVYAHEREDFFTGARGGHVSEIAVARGTEGTGVAGALMRAAERWAAGRGYGRLSLNVFAGNARARRFYERLGFEPETLSYSKAIASGDPSADARPD
jgi:GNAT superfamily N-acetyltransferase